MSTFKAGDKVHLKTGNQRRTVEYIDEDGVHCITELKDGNIVRDTFAPETLEHVRPDPTPEEIDAMIRMI